MRSDHHFKFIQFPFNIQESDAYTNKNLNGKSLIQFAKENQLSCITARPLTAHVGNQIYQFINLEEPEGIIIQNQTLICRFTYSCWKFKNHVRRYHTNRATSSMELARRWNTRSLITTSICTFMGTGMNLRILKS